MAKRKRSYRRYFARAKHRAKKMTIPIAVAGGIIGSPAVSGMIQSAAKGAFWEIPLWAKGLAGVTNDNQFDFNLLQRNYLPILAGFGVHKLAGILGVNRALGQAGVPFVRV